jgi:hypothetical protein
VSTHFTLRPWWNFQWTRDIQNCSWFVRQQEPGTLKFAKFDVGTEEFQDSTALVQLHSVEFDLDYHRRANVWAPLPMKKNIIEHETLKQTTTRKIQEWSQLIASVKHHQATELQERQNPLPQLPRDWGPVQFPEDVPLVMWLLFPALTKHTSKNIDTH